MEGGVSLSPTFCPSPVVILLNVEFYDNNPASQLWIECHFVIDIPDRTEDQGQEMTYSNRYWTTRRLDRGKDNRSPLRWMRVSVWNNDDDRSSTGHGFGGADRMGLQ